LKAMVYEGPGKPPAWKDVPDPKIIEPTDAIVKVDTTTICGTDLHILKGDVPQVTPGRILGHEAVGHVVEVGSAVKDFKVGDRVVVACVVSCGKCEYCKNGMESHCQNAAPEGTPDALKVGWIFGHLIDGTQAEKVLVPYADGTLHHAPDDLTDEQLVMLSDIYPTGYEIGVKYGAVKDGDVVTVIGSGPVGLAAVATAKLRGAKKVVVVDIDQSRLDEALKMGADVAVLNDGTPDNPNGTWVDKVKAEARDSLGVDVAIEAVGIPATLQACYAVVRPGGHVANAGVHGAPVELPLENAWIQNLTMTTGLVDANTIPELMAAIESGKLKSEQMVSHRYKMSDFDEAYKVFGKAGSHDGKTVLKMAIAAD